MTCPECGREAENGTPTHWLGCDYTAKAAAELEATLDAMCDHPGCDKPKKPWSGKGAKPKYCADGHK